MMSTTKKIMMPASLKKMTDAKKRGMPAPAVVMALHKDEADGSVSYDLMYSDEECESGVSLSALRGDARGGLLLQRNRHVGGELRVELGHARLRGQDDGAAAVREAVARVQARRRARRR